MRNPWYYSENVFLNSSRGSFSKFLVICSFTNNALAKKAGDPFFDALIAFFQPLAQFFRDELSDLGLASGDQKGDTVEVYRLLRLLSSDKLSHWDSMAQIVYPKKTRDYVRLFPKGHEPFQTGRIDERLNVVQSLSKACDNIPLLADLKSDVDAFLSEIETARNSQVGEKSEKKVQSKDVKQAMEAAAKGMMRIYARLVDEYVDDLKQIEPFFDLKNIRNGLQSEFTGSVKPDTTRFVLQRTFEPGDAIRINNTGTTQLKFCLSDSKKGTVPASAIIVEGGETKTVTAEQLGAIQNAFLLCRNADPAIKGQYIVEIL